MCVLSIKVPIQKSLETYLMILVYDILEIILLLISFLNEFEQICLHNSIFIVST